MDRWQQSDWIFSAQNDLFCPCLWKYYNSPMLDVSTACTTHFPWLSILPTLTLAATPITLPYSHSLWHLFYSFFSVLFLYHVDTWILSFPGYVDRALLWSPDWLQTQNNPLASVLWVMGFQAYTTYSGRDISLNSLFRSRWITWEEKLFCLFLPIVQSTLNNLHVSIGHVVRCLT